MQNKYGLSTDLLREEPDEVSQACMTRRFLSWLLTFLSLLITCCALFMLIEKNYRCIIIFLDIVMTGVTKSKSGAQDKLDFSQEKHIFSSNVLMSYGKVKKFNNNVAN